VNFEINKSITKLNIRFQNGPTSKWNASSWILVGNVSEVKYNK